MAAEAGRTVAVIGAGVVGIAIARTLQQAGWTVTVFDPAQPGSGTSFGNAGHIAIDHVRPLARPDVVAGLPRMIAAPLGPLALRMRGLPALSPWLLRFAAAARPARVAAGTAALAGLLARSLPDWIALLHAAGLSDMLRQDGALAVSETQAGLRAATAEAAILRAHGIRFHDLSPAEVAAHLPALAITPAGGRLFPGAAHVVHPFRLVQALAARFAADGGTILQRPATPLPDGTLATPDGLHRPDRTILAAGPATPALLRPLGLRLPLTRERGYHAMLDHDAIRPTLPTTFNERGFVVTPMEHGTRLAGTVELGAGTAPPAWARADILATHAARLFGRPVQVRDRWHGDRPTLPDYLPAIGPVPGIPGLLVATGHQHLGLTLAATTGLLVAGLLAGTPAPPAFAVTRFGNAAPARP